MIKQPQSIETKIIGSFVRVKSDPCDYNQRNSHQLVQITGVKQGSRDKDNNEIVLQVSNMFMDICLSMLSDDNFTTEECEELREKVKAGLLKRPTVVELESKAIILHQDITKHWIARELSLLQKLIDRANEKGWRREFFIHMERKKNLEKPSEQMLLLQKLPTVTPDVLELQPSAEHKSRDHKCSQETAPFQVVNECSEPHGDHTVILELPPPHASPPMTPPTPLLSPYHHQQCLPWSADDSKSMPHPSRVANPPMVAIQKVEVKRNEVIDLSSDDEENSVIATEDPDKCIWNISGQTEKYSLSVLKRWYAKIPSSASKFKVWKEVQTEEKAICLTKALNLDLPRSTPVIQIIE